MGIDRDTVHYVAGLARLRLTEQELDELTDTMGTILEYVDKLNELDTTDIEPTSHVVDISGHLRPDRVEPGVTQEQALANAPDTKDGLFKVPRIIEE